jgi:flagellar biosynthesis protein FlhG
MADLNQRFTEYLGRELEKLGTAYDCIVVDTAAGISAQVVEFLGIADEIVVVTTPNLASILDAYSVVKVVCQNRLDGRTRLLVNQAKDEEEACAVSGRIRGCARKFLNHAPDYIGFLYRDRLVESANAGQQPLVVAHPTARNTRHLRNMASTLIGVKPGERARRPGRKTSTAARTG